MTPSNQQYISVGELKLLVVQADDGHFYLQVSDLFLLLGNSQYERSRLKRQVVMGTGHKVDGDSETSCEHREDMLRLDRLALWLATLDLAEIDQVEIRQYLEEYQREAALVLHEAFCQGRLTDKPRLAERLQQNTLTARLYREVLSILCLARNQILDAPDVGPNPSYQQ